MTDLKYLEEVLPAYREGKTIEFVANKYENTVAGCDIRGYTLQSLLSEYLKRQDSRVITLKAWRIRKKLVPWPVAWEALKGGKKVVVDNREWILWPNHNKPQGIEWTNCDGVTNAIESNIPISWLDREDFEVIDD